MYRATLIPSLRSGIILRGPLTPRVLLRYVMIRFSSPPQYYIYPCATWTNFPVSLPTDEERVWRITLNRNSGIRLLIHCNNVEVLNILMSSTCSSSYWSTRWSRTVGTISFHPTYDTASDYYRAGQSGIIIVHCMKKLWLISCFAEDTEIITI